MKWKIENLKAAGIAWSVTMILILINMFVEVIREGKLSILSTIFFISMVVYFASLLYKRRKQK